MRSDQENEVVRSWGRPELERPAFQPLSDEEAAAIWGARGGKAGTCVAIGFACWKEGGVHFGLCAIVGYTSG